MTKRMDVGRSPRTPAKHAAMNNIFGREVGVINESPKHRDILRLHWLDLSAGNGLVPEDVDWKFNCSPGIAAYHATRSRKPVAVTLFEIKPATFDLLIENLETQLPKLGYYRADHTVWTHGLHVLQAVNASGGDASISHIGRTDAVLVSNDPNAITDWVMRPGFAAELHARTWCCRSISTMGCNVGGLLRLDFEERAGWFDLIKQQEAATPRHRDLLLAAIEGDASKWAYLFSEPTAWRTSVEQSLTTAFRRYGYELDMAWYRQNPDQFERAKADLFLTKKERGERA